VKQLGRAVYAFDPEGSETICRETNKKIILVFGSEDSGLLPSIKQDADYLVRIPMNPLVSSMNLATSVAVGLSIFKK
jgi:tRNA G18 (ribose-2'-O)-methylase SpoU